MFGADALFSLWLLNLHRRKDRPNPSALRIIPTPPEITPGVGSSSGDLQHHYFLAMRARRRFRLRCCLKLHPRFGLPDLRRNRFSSRRAGHVSLIRLQLNHTLALAPQPGRSTSNQRVESREFHSIKPEETEAGRAQTLPNPEERAHALCCCDCADCTLTSSQH